MTDRELMQQALEALEQSVSTCFDQYSHHEVMSRSEHFMNRAMKALRERLAQPEQEPVAWEQFYPNIGKPQIEQPKVRTGDCLLVGVCALEGHKIQAKQEQEEYLSKAYRLANELRCHLAIAPAPQRTWVGLTDEEIENLMDVYDVASTDYARTIEAKLKEKNT